jgi:hypothetical protein
LPSYAELTAVLELAPWSGEADNRQRPDANLRTHSRRPQRPGEYLILEDQRRVIVLRVL